MSKKKLKTNQSLNMSIVDPNTTKFGQSELSRILNDINPATTMKSKVSSLVAPA